MSQHKPNQKLLMLGLDAALPDLIAKFTAEGSMPVTKKLIEKGWFSRMITTFPPLTAAAWGAITTGAITMKKAARGAAHAPTPIHQRRPHRRMARYSNHRRGCKYCWCIECWWYS